MFGHVMICGLTILAVVCSIQAADITYHMSEESPANVRIGNIVDDYNLTTMFPPDQYPNLETKVIPKAMPFRTDVRTGELFNTAMIDRESIPANLNSTISFEIVAFKAFDAFRHLINIGVDVIIDDINDNAPVFPSRAITVNFSEYANIGASMPIPVATDQDLGINSVQAYYLNPINVPFTLLILLQTFVDGRSELTLKVTSALDREQQDGYLLSILVVDGGIPQRSGTLDVSVIITDENDNPPVFQQSVFNFSIKKGAAIATVIGRLIATDADSGMNGQITYTLSPDNSDEVTAVVEIDSITGSLKVKGQLPPGEFDVYVRALDNGIPQLSSRVRVHVTVQASNTPPHLYITNLHDDNGTVNLIESIPIGSVVANLNVVDNDTGSITALQCQSLSDTFKLVKYDYDEYKVVVARALDHEQDIEHEVEFVCYDNGNPPLNASVKFTVHVLDVNDEPPEFFEAVYNISVQENNAMGTVIVVVRASDRDSGENGRITYSLYYDSGQNIVIDANTGIIQANAVLDREVVSEIVLIVQATDQGNPRLSTSAKVVINVLDVNDNAPVFSQSSYEFYIHSDVTYNTTVGHVVATDIDIQDNGIVDYSIHNKPGSLGVPFSIKLNGEIHVSRSLEHDPQKMFTFLVVATDRGIPSLTSTTNVIVNII